MTDALKLADFVASKRAAGLTRGEVKMEIRERELDGRFRPPISGVQFPPKEVV